jgi:AcrR family transcriptional regulator
MELSSPSANQRPYHHGDLRRSLIDAALDTIAEDSPAAVNLRALARRVGVSHAAPAHHFRDKANLFTAIATEGFGLLASKLQAAYDTSADFLEVGVAYVRFALDHRAHFEVMFRPELYHAHDPALQKAHHAAEAALYGPLGDVPNGELSSDVLAAGVAAWSLAHGLATLWLSGNLPRELGHDPEQVMRIVASHLFQAGLPPHPGAVS